MAESRHTKNEGNIEVILIRVDAPESKARINRALELILSAVVESDPYSPDETEVKESAT